MQINQILKDVKKEILNLYGKRLSKLILYGSYARGEANEDSDIDLLIVLKGRVNEKKDTNKKNDIIYDLVLKYNEDISAIVVSENQYKTNNMPIYLNVRNDGTDLLRCGEIFTPQKMKKIYCERKLKYNRILFNKNFKPMKYKKEIELLISQTKDEFEACELLFQGRKYRQCVSRCYYSMFHSAQAVLFTKNIDPSHFQHKTIISKFGELFVKTGVFPKEMSKDFKEAKEKREQGDYNYNVLMSNEFAAEVMEKGKKFNQTIENYIQKEMKKEQNNNREMKM